LDFLCGDDNGRPSDRGTSAVQHGNKHQIIILLPRNLGLPIRFEEHRPTWAASKEPAKEANNQSTREEASRVCFDPGDRRTPLVCLHKGINMGWIEDNELPPELQKLVDRFGQAQTFEVPMALAHSVCPDGANNISGSLCAWQDCDRVFDGRMLPEDWATLTTYRSKRPIRNFRDISAEGLLCDAVLCPEHTKQLNDQLKDIGRALSELPARSA
jgi:hypothetical protein